MEADRKSWNDTGVDVVAGIPDVAIVATAFDSAEGFVVALAAFVAVTAIVVVVADIAYRSQHPRLSLMVGGKKLITKAFFVMLRVSLRMHKE
uniref:Uncharacterized protein n=1 Tax=Angiostrongylus cantonensis TaxID=6313 RepID=A0A0K0CVB9_ANGCA